MSKNEQGLIITNTTILKKFKRWAWVLILINVFTMITTLIVLGSMQQLYRKIDGLNIMNNYTIEKLSDKICSRPIKDQK